METCSVCSADDGPTLRQCNMCASKFHHMCIVEEAAKNGWPEATSRTVCCACGAIIGARGAATCEEARTSVGSEEQGEGARFHKNDKKLLAFYADCQDFMLSGVVTEVRYVVGSENDPDIDTPGKKTKTEAKAMVALYKITWNHTRFQRDEPWITARLFYKGVLRVHVCLLCILGVEQFATLMRTNV
ncbi:hypothetical protein DYB31_004887 [Aphanomyces astaci]|uniref:Zinc finger PHD-type domain-containing protein n=1 Tax=Aphanomyces astaci TaxID=112090 RepID=A0A397FH34_APHAT|nr:hypothetical protein DYB31_004887 [Aphanomyces astaci]